MPAYVIASVTDAWDSEKLAEYRRRNTDVVAAHGGRFLVRGGEHETLEGNWTPVRLVVMEFPDRDAARAWYESDDYAPLRELRRQASDTEIVLVEGYGAL
jgi:uncharacterized protein (DUF1330 family)